MKKWRNKIISGLVWIGITGAAQQTPVVQSTSSTDTLLAQKGTEKFLTIQRLVNTYGPFSQKSEKDILTSVKPQNLQTLLVDGTCLLEGFFAHAAMLLDLSLFAGIDSTFKQFIDPTHFFNNGIVKPVTLNQQKVESALSSSVDSAPPPPTTAAPAQSNVRMLLPNLCAALFHASRYTRIIAQGIGNTTNPADLCAGIIIINNGWVCSLTMPSLNSDRVQKKGGLFCLPAGVSGQNIKGEILGFVKNHSVDFIPFNEGVDAWSPYNNNRTMKLVVADDVGSAAFVASQLGDGKSAITVQISKQGNVSINDAQGNVMSNLTMNSAIKNFYNTLSGPWAVLIEMNNQDFSQGDLFPTFEIKGLVKLNYFDFPLQFQAPQSQKIGYPFSLQSLFEAPSMLVEEVQGLSRYTQGNLENNFMYGKCKEYVVNVSLPVFKKNDLYVDPINTGMAKIKGALSYDWETQKYTIQDALDGISKLMSTLYFRRQNINPDYILHNLKSDSNVLLI